MPVTYKTSRLNVREEINGLLTDTLAYAATVPMRPVSALHLPFAITQWDVLRAIALMPTWTRSWTLRIVPASSNLRCAVGGEAITSQPRQWVAANITEGTRMQVGDWPGGYDGPVNAAGNSA